MRRPTHRNLTLAALAAALLLLPNAAGAADPALAAEPFRPVLSPLIDAAAASSTDAAKTARMESALDAGAVFFAVNLAGEIQAAAFEQRAWADAQLAPAPLGAFRDALLAEHDAARDAFDEAIKYLRSATHARIPANRADALLAAAQLMDDAGATLDAAGPVIAALPDNGASSSLTRYTLARGVLVAAVELRAAQGLMALDLPHDGQDVDVAAMAQHLQALQSMGQAPGQAPGGPIHQLALYGATLGNAHRFAAPAYTPDVVTYVLQHAAEELEEAATHGWQPATLGAAIQDLQWYSASLPSEWTDAERDLASRLGARLEGSNGAVDILQATLVPAPDRVDLAKWLGLGALVAGAALVALLAVNRVRRRAAAPPAPAAAPGDPAGTADAPQGPALAWVLPLVFVLLLAGVPVGARADPLPADPASVPVAFTGAAGIAADGDFLQSAAGELLFVWNECTGTNEQCVRGEPSGHLVLRGRTYDPDSDAWSAVQTVHDSGKNSMAPRLAKSGQDTWLFWIQGWTAMSSGPISLQGCKLADGVCQAPVTLSSGAGYVRELEVATGPDGTIAVLWTLETPATPANATAVWLKRLTPGGGWSSAISFPTGSYNQYHPALAIDADGRVHAAWRQRYPVPPTHPSYNSAGWAFLTATIEPDEQAARLGPALTDHAGTRNPRMELAVLEGRVHALYADGLDVFATSRPAVAGDADDAEWSARINVTRFQTLPSSWLGLSSHAGGLVATGYNTLNGVPSLWIARLDDGIWSRPAVVVSSPYSFVAPIARQAPDGQIHLAWYGEGPGVNANQMHYRLLQTVPAVDLPPTLRDPTPTGWTNQAVPLLGVTVESEAGIASSSRFRVDGVERPYVLEGSRMWVGADGLAEGLHTASVDFVDRAGRGAALSWQFGVDRTAPAFTQTIADDLGPAPPGPWLARRPTLGGTLVADNGSPAHLQASLSYAVQGQVVDSGWLDVVGDGVKLDAGRLYNVQLRAIDEAGNAATGPRLSLGWDNAPPQLAPQVPAWARGTTVRVPLGSDAAGEGSAVTVRGTLLHDGVVLLEAEAALAASVLELGPLQDGTYQLRLAAADAVGHQQDLGVHPVGVDNTQPMLEVLADGDVVVVTAQDVGSGLALLEATAGPQVLSSAVAEPFVLRFPRDQSARADLLVRDQAGNERHVRLDADLGLIEVQSKDDVAPKEPDRGAGSPPAAFLATCLLLAALAARRRA